MQISGADFTVFYYLQKYRYLTIEQARLAAGDGKSYQTTARRLRTLQAHNFLSSYGGHREGYINTPKIYFLTPKGYTLLETESGISPDLLEPFKRTSKPHWTIKTMHRIKLIDIFIALENSISQADFLELEKVFLEYNFNNTDSGIASETTDIFNDEKIIPDGAFILKSRRTSAKNLFFVEADLATEQITTRFNQDRDFTLIDKFAKYDRYLTSGAFAEKYKTHGRFDHFVMLFVSTSGKRLMNLREKSRDLSGELHEYYLLNTFEEATNGFFARNWITRDTLDNGAYSVLG